MATINALKAQVGGLETPPAANKPAPAPAGQVPVVGSQDEYDALPSGATYQDAQGNIRRKK